MIVAPDEMSAGVLGTEAHKEELERLIEEKIGKNSRAGDPSGRKWRAV